VSEARKRMDNISRQAVSQLIKRGVIPTATDEEIEAAGIDPRYVPPGRVFLTERAIEQYLAYKAAGRRQTEGDGEKRREEDT
jgi:hypothetical protein